MRERTRMLVVTSAVLFFSVLIWFNYSAVLPAIIRDWGLSGTRAGIIFSAFQVGYLVTIVPIGALADRYSPRWVIAIGAAGTGLASLVFGLTATGFLSGSVLRFIAGAFMAGVYVPGMRFISDWYAPRVRGRAMGIYVGAYSFSSGLAFIVGSHVEAIVDWQTAILVTSLGAVVIAPAMVVFARDADRGVARHDRRFDLAVLKNRAYLYAVGVYTLHAWELFGVRNWILVFLVAAPVFAGGTSPITAGTIVGVMFLLGGPGNLLGGWLSDRLGRTQTIGLALGASAVISTVIPFLSGIPLWALTAVVLLYGIVLTADSSPVSTSITEVVDDENVGVALSLQSLIGYFGAAVSPVVFGVALDGYDFTVAFWTLAVAALVGLGSLWALHRRTEGATQ